MPLYLQSLEEGRTGVKNQLTLAEQKLVKEIAQATRTLLFGVGVVNYVCPIADKFTTDILELVKLALPELIREAGRVGLVSSCQMENVTWSDSP